MRPTMEKKEIEKKLNLSIAKLFRNDASLLEIDASERSITHRIAVYLEAEFKGWNVDCEYNRDLNQSKKLKSLLTEKGDPSLVLPDIIIHHRGTYNNLLVLELKKSSNDAPDSDDENKIHCYIQDLGYQHGVFIRINTDSYFDGSFTIKWFEKV